ncbi:deoxycytidylate deaminase [Trichodelitschia bisporula]|uniref:Deoxycytidylate deaminase n=1 Tax=Trichodelitschia bisporula TaxID=703511 RepID=A0A6G1I2I8_9PEZI|nr:deoxycytidylate deaminase [Trichodelitschia bisporula]
MLIGVCGSICAGKTSVVEYLVKEHGFQLLSIELPSDYPPRLAELLESRDTPPDATFRFRDAQSLLDFVTENWRGRWVTSSVWDESVLDILLKRPFFLFISVDAPGSVRWNRLLARCSARRCPMPMLDSFLLYNDNEHYTPVSGLAPLLGRAQLRLLNSTSSLSQLHEALAKLDLPNESRLRPSWDQYFMQLAHLAAQRSNCMKRRVGCVLVREKRVISTGYNGTPRGMRNCNDGGCPRCNDASGVGVGLDTCLCLHAEENALLEAGRDRIRDGSILYCDTCPCLTCSVKIAQVGISEVVYSVGYNVDSAAAAIFQEAGVKLRQFSPPREGLVDLAAGFQAVTSTPF